MRNRKILCIATFCLFLLGSDEIFGQTFAKDIAPLIYNRCATCHRSGEIGPMPLTNYEEVRPFAQTIKVVTQSRYMPPWQPEVGYNHFLEENYLTDDQIDLISRWVDAGAPYGNTADEPDLPLFAEDSQLGIPDLVLTMSQPHLHKGTGTDSYYYFVLPTGLTEDKVLKAIELRPGNPQIVHHCLFFEDNLGIAAAEDAKSSEYGFDGFGNFGIAQVLNFKQYPGYVPGTKPHFYPEGQGQILQAGADLVIQMHYAPWPIDSWDQSTVNLFFADEDEVVDREVQEHIMLPLPATINESFVIAPNQVKTFHGEWRVNKKLSFMGLSPHMHYLGKNWEVYMEHPDGRITPLIKINDWDFNWQGAYYFDRLHVAEAGTTIHAIATYDNTSQNPSNPSSPPKFVSWGERTEDEMYYLPLYYLDYFPGDEEVRYTTSISEVFSSNDPLFNMKVFPNPLVSNQMGQVTLSIQRGSSFLIEVRDMSGRLHKTIRNGEFFSKGEHIITFSTAGLAPQMMIVRVVDINTRQEVSVPMLIQKS